MTKPYQIAAKGIIFSEDAVLLLKRSEKERAGNEEHVWDFPGGCLETEEPIMDALKREVMEETGLTVNVISPAYIYDDIQGERHLIILKFVCDQPSGQLKLSAEHESYHWIKMDELQKSGLPEWMKKEVRRAYRMKAI